MHPRQRICHFPPTKLHRPTHCHILVIRSLYYTAFAEPVPRHTVKSVFMSSVPHLKVGIAVYRNQDEQVSVWLLVTSPSNYRASDVSIHLPLTMRPDGAWTVLARSAQPLEAALSQAFLPSFKCVAVIDLCAIRGTAGVFENVQDLLYHCARGYAGRRHGMPLARGEVGFIHEVISALCKERYTALPCPIDMINTVVGNVTSRLEMEDRPRTSFPVIPVRDAMVCIPR